MLFDFYGKTPDQVTEAELQTIYSTAKTSINGLSPLYESDTAASSFFSLMCSNASGTLCI